MSVPAHSSPITRHYTMHYPEHPARESDPHYVDFHHIRKAWAADPERWHCDIGHHRNDYTECDLTRPLELHHAHVEFSLQNGIELTWLAADYPGIDLPDEVGAWVESADNLALLCCFHHRGHGGIHVAASSDYEAGKYVRGLIT